MSDRSMRTLLATRQAIEAWRDRSFRRLPALRVRGERSALQFVNAVGFCFTLSHFGLPVASLYVAVCGRRNPRWPKRTHHDAEIGLAWNLKNSLPAKRLAHYGKLVKGKPTLVSLDLFPAFCALIREGKGSGDYIVEPKDLEKIYRNEVDLVIDAGPKVSRPSTVIDLTEGDPVVIREGKGEIFF